VVATVTGLSGLTAEAPFAGVTVTFAAAGALEGLALPGVADAPGLPVLCGVPDDACELLHALPNTNTAQTTATARPCFLTELLNMP
jgi:hypothetical protein